jgi:L-threonylcarbamoyladenylate synthase
MNKPAASIHTISQSAIDGSVDVLRAGGIVAFPTETYYGLAVDPFNREALSSLFAAKKRAASKPILTLINSREQLSLLARHVSSKFTLLMDQFWPGPLTLIFDAQENLPSLLTGDTGTIGIRQSSHPVANMLVAAFAGPITATSANISGQAPAITAQEIERYFGANINMVLDGGKTPGGMGSTIIGIKEDKLQLIRDGVVPYGKVTAALSSHEGRTVRHETQFL